MSYNLFLDDNRDPCSFLNDTRTWYIVRNYNQFVEVITTKGLPDLISFDHDLADEHYANPNDYDKFVEKTGYDCAKWLIEYCMRTNQPLPEWQIHSFNVGGMMNIHSILSTFRDKEEDIHE